MSRFIELEMSLTCNKTINGDLQCKPSYSGLMLISWLNSEYNIKLLFLRKFWQLLKRTNKLINGKSCRVGGSRSVSSDSWQRRLEQLQIRTKYFNRKYLHHPGLGIVLRTVSSSELNPIKALRGKFSAYLNSGRNHVISDWFPLSPIRWNDNLSLHPPAS